MDAWDVAQWPDVTGGEGLVAGFRMDGVVRTAYPWLEADPAARYRVTELGSGRCRILSGGALRKRGIVHAPGAASRGAMALEQC